MSTSLDENLLISPNLPEDILLYNYKEWDINPNINEDL